MTPPEDIDALWQHFAWAQKLGVKWFNISLDDISAGINAGGQARAVNALLQRLRAQDPEAQLTFCPTWYSGTGESGVETNTTLGAKAESGDVPAGDTSGRSVHENAGQGTSSRCVSVLDWTRCLLPDN